MCVIVVKPRGKRLPPKSVLEKCWDHNSHGAGYAICSKKSSITRVQKGFMDFGAFYKALLEETINKRDLVLMHFRLKTHGAMSPEHTHPFPISIKKEELEALAYQTNMVCAHNGIFSLTGQPSDMSDTMYYIKGWLSQMDLTQVSSAGSAVKKELEDDCSYNKIALIINGSIHLFGNWSKHQGCYYSNLYFDYKLNNAGYRSSATSSVGTGCSRFEPTAWTPGPHGRHYRRRDNIVEYGGWEGDFC